MKRSRLRRSPSMGEDRMANQRALDRMEQASKRLQGRFKLPDDPD